MKEKQNKRWGLKLVSLLSAFLVWLAVVNVADPVMSAAVDVPIEIINGHVLEEKGLTYEIIGKKNTTVSYEVNTTNAYRIRSSDFRAYADLTELWSVTGSVPIKVEILNNSDLIRSNPVSKISTIKIETELLQTKKFELNTTVLGTVEEGHKVGEVKATPNYVYVEGPESLVGQISGAGIEIDAEGVSADTNGTAKIYYYDANGNKITLNERLSTGCNEVDYALQILKVKTVALDYEVTGEVADRRRFTGVETDRRTIEVVGMKSVLAPFNTLTISGDVLNIDGADENVARTIDLTKYLPEGVTLAGDENPTLDVVLAVERLDDKVYTIEVNEDCLVGQLDGFTYTPEPGYINVRVRALEEELDVLELGTSDIEIDVSEMEEGINGATVNLITELDPVYEVIYVTICNINVSLGEAEENDDVSAGSMVGSGYTSTEASKEAAD